MADSLTPANKTKIRQFLKSFDFDQFASDLIELGVRELKDLVPITDEQLRHLGASDDEIERYRKHTSQLEGRKASMRTPEPERRKASHQDAHQHHHHELEPPPAELQPNWRQIQQHNHSPDPNPQVHVVVKVDMEERDGIDPATGFPKHKPPAKNLSAEALNAREANLGVYSSRWLTLVTASLLLFVVAAVLVAVGAGLGSCTGGLLIATGVCFLLEGIVFIPCVFHSFKHASGRVVLGSIAFTVLFMAVLWAPSYC